MNSCLLRAKTVTAAASLVINPVAARMYRARMINRQIEASDSERDKVDYEGLDEKALGPIVEEYNQIYPDKRSIDERMKSDTPGQKRFLENPRNFLAHFFPHLRDEEKMTTEKAIAGIRNNIAKLDAAELARKWWSKVSVPLIGEVYLPTTRFRPEIRDANIPTFWKRPETDLCERPGWSKARCARAISALDRWEIDFKWTEEQHRKGATFGWQKCRRLGTDESLEKLACQAINTPLNPAVSSPKISR